MKRIGYLRAGPALSMLISAGAARDEEAPADCLWIARCGRHIAEARDGCPHLSRSERVGDGE